MTHIIIALANRENMISLLFYYRNCSKITTKKITTFGISVRLGMWDLCQGQSWLGSYRNTYVRGIYLICIRSIVGISVRVSDLGLMSGSELVLPSELLAVRLRVQTFMLHRHSFNLCRSWSDLRTV